MIRAVCSLAFDCNACSLSVDVTVHTRESERAWSWYMLDAPAVRCPSCGELLPLQVPKSARAVYEPPAIESTRVLEPGELAPTRTAAQVLAAAQLTPEQIEERRRIGERREPKRTAALAHWMKRSLEHAAEPCGFCDHARGVHTPDCEDCDCEHFAARM